MQLQANAKTTPQMRDLIVRRVVRHDWTYREAAEAAGVSVRTVAKRVLKRFGETSWAEPTGGERGCATA